MDLTKLEQKLIAAARLQESRSDVPFGYPRRIMAVLRERSGFDAAALWARALWRGAAASLTLVILLAAFSITLSTDRSSEPMNDLSQQFEKTLFAAVDQAADASR